MMKLIAVIDERNAGKGKVSGQVEDDRAYLGKTDVWRNDNG